jgi:hypothetical protein
MNIYLIEFTGDDEIKRTDTVHSKAKYKIGDYISNAENGGIIIDIIQEEK